MTAFRDEHQAGTTDILAEPFRLTPGDDLVVLSPDDERRDVHFLHLHQKRLNIIGNDLMRGFDEGVETAGKIEKLRMAPDTIRGYF